METETVPSLEEVPTVDGEDKQNKSIQVCKITHLYFLRLERIQLQ